MSQLVQIIYISRSSSLPDRQANAVDPVVARILAKSRANNRKNGLVGVLYFGDGCFFQCLEGEETAVNTLYAKLEQDARHRDLKIISRKPIAAPTFQDWSMKYVPVEQAITALLRRRGMHSFDPYQFDQAATDEVIGLLHAAAEPDTAPLSPVAQVAPERVAEPAPGVPSRGGFGGQQIALAALVLLVAAGGLVALMGS